MPSWMLMLFGRSATLRLPTGFSIVSTAVSTGWVRASCWPQFGWQRLLVAISHCVALHGREAGACKHETLRNLSTAPRVQEFPWDIVGLRYRFPNKFPRTVRSHLSRLGGGERERERETGPACGSARQEAVPRATLPQAVLDLNPHDVPDPENMLDTIRQRGWLRSCSALGDMLGVFSARLSQADVAFSFLDGGRSSYPSVFHRALISAM